MLSPPFAPDRIVGGKSDRPAGQCSRHPALSRRLCCQCPDEQKARLFSSRVRALFSINPQALFFHDQTLSGALGPGAGGLGPGAWGKNRNHEKEGLYPPGAASTFRAASSTSRFCPIQAPCGEVAEWLNAPHSKCGIRATVSGVRIPPSPPFQSASGHANRRR